MNSSELKKQICKIEAADFNQAKQIQINLAAKITLNDEFSEISSVAGLDVGFEKNNTIAIGGIVILGFPDFNVIEKHISRRKVIFPYVPGYLSFREIPVLLQTYNKIHHKPDLIICDGQGIAHPRRFGLACHLGILLDLPAIGAGKSRLIGQFTEPPLSRGSSSPLVHQNQTVGAVVRSRHGTRPLFVSPGHKISIGSAVEWTMNCCPKYRIPETTRQAHKLVSG